jgi:hypothetical protein
MGPTGAKPALIQTPRCDLPTTKSDAPLRPASPHLRNSIAAQAGILSPALRNKMTVLKPRSRTISIRLSEEEFLTLKHLCSVTGARSVSDLTRDAMRVALHGVNRDDLLGFRMDEFGAMLKDLDRKLDQLAAGIESFKGER